MHGRFTVFPQVEHPGYGVGLTENLLSAPPVPRCYTPIRYHQGYGSDWLLDQMIVRFFDSSDKTELIKELRKLPRSIIRTLYETGVQIVLLNTKFSTEPSLYINQEKIWIHLETILGSPEAGQYIPLKNLIMLPKKSIAMNECYPPYYLAARAVEQAILTFPKTARIRSYELRPNTSMALPHILDLSLERSSTYFYECFHDFFHPDRSASLKSTDRVIYRLFEKYLTFNSDFFS